MIEILIGEKLIQLSSDQKVWTIGRDKNCDIQISDRTISRRHCAIYINKGVATIIDGDLIANKPSANGVRVNSVLLDFNHGQILNDKDVIELSPTISFRFFSENEREAHPDDTVL